MIEQINKDGSITYRTITHNVTFPSRVYEPPAENIALKFTLRNVLGAIRDILKEDMMKLTLLKKINMKKLLLLLILLMPHPCFADTITASWDAVTLGTDGLPVVGLQGYKLYESTTSGTYGSTPKATSTTNTVAITETVPGKYFLVVTAYNATGESGKSNEVTFTVLAKVPGIPANLTYIQR